MTPPVASSRPATLSRGAGSGQPIRIAMVVHGLAGGGLERAVRDLTLQLHERGFQPAVFSTAQLGLYFEELESRGVPVSDCRGTGGGLRIPGVPRLLLRKLREFQPDIIHSHSGTILPSSVSRLLLRSPRLIFTDHGRYPEPRWVSYVERACLTQVDRYVAVAEELARYVQGYLAMAEPPLVIPNGIDQRPYSGPAATSREALRAEWEIAPEEVLLMSVGRLAPVKNHSFLLRGLAEAARTRPEIRLALVGDGSLEPELRAECRQLGLDPRVRWLGFRKDIADCLRAADLFVMSSDSEGLPLVLLEAMAAGLPIVSTEVGGIPTALEGSGLLVPPRDVPRLAAAITALAGDPARRRALGQAAQQRSALYSIEAVGERYITLYREVLGRRPATRSQS